ncbi:MAG: TVP38/TMEM64 family protein [Spirochaetota bacterium]
MADDGVTRKSSPKTRLIIGATILALLIVAGIVFDFGGTLRSALEYIRDMHLVTGALVFMVLYTVTTVFLVPGSIPTLAAGAIFGVIQGTAFVSLGSTVGATVAFFVGRYFARDWVRLKIQGRPRFAAIDDAIGREGWKIIGLLRLSPVVPFSLSNYFYGITKVRPIGYILSSWIGMLPGTLMYVYFGSLAGTLAALGTEGGTGFTALQWVFYGVGFVATITVTIFVTRLARRAVNHALETPDDEPGSEGHTGADAEHGTAAQNA